MHATKQPTNLARPLGISAALHLSVVALAMIAYRKQAPEVLPPIYKVDIVAAPPGERAIGEVKPEEAPVVTPPAAAPLRRRNRRRRQFRLPRPFLKSLAAIDAGSTGREACSKDCRRQEPVVDRRAGQEPTSQQCTPRESNSRSPGI
jgi:hypothetical protein